MKKIVVTGGVYSGKTTIIEDLRDGGITTAPEALLQIVHEQRERIGEDNWKDWVIPNYSRFIELAAERQARIEEGIVTKHPHSQFCVYDRGMIDLVAFCWLRKIDVPDRLAELVKQTRYDFVFSARTFNDFDPRPESGRIITRDESFELVDLCSQAYKEFGYDVRELLPGKGPIQQKTSPILRVLF
jgi:predicted ATPase